jgi:MoaA/NifB/PqqE/SkfB family radical SAM enzyme
MNWYNYARYIRFILRGKKPKLVILDITSSCNSQCLFCPRTRMPKNRKNGIMTKTVFNHALTEIKKHHVEEVRLYSTGEPLLHPDFDYIIRRLYDEGLLITISTNGTLLNKHRDSLMLVDHLQLSIDGWDQESYEYLQPPNNYKKTLDEVISFCEYALLQDTRPLITINLLQTKKTDVMKFHETWDKYVDGITMNHLMGTTYYNGNRFITEQHRQLKDYLYPFSIDTKHGCEYPFDVLTVAFDGKISLCCQDYNTELPLGYIDDGLKSVFNSDQMMKIRSDFVHGVPTVCAGCSRFYKVKE